MNLAIVGTRTFNNYSFLEEKVDLIIKIEDLKEVVIISGEPEDTKKKIGADVLSITYAKNKGYRYIGFSPNWDMYGKPAGPIRNTEIVKSADLLVAFWNGISPGTKDTITKAQVKGIKVFTYIS
jgi:hypothetical protein